MIDFHSMSFRAALRGVALTPLLVACAVAYQAPKRKQPAKRKALTTSQIEQLVSVKAPDMAIAKEIAERGLATIPSQSLLDALAKRGAGEQTLQAISRLLPRASLTIT